MRSKALSSPDDDVALVGTLSLVRSARVGADDHALTRWRFCAGRVDVGRHDQDGGDRPRHACAIPERDEHRAARAPVVGLWRQRHCRARHLHRRRVRAAVVCRRCALSLICPLAVTRQQMRVRHRHAGRGGVWLRATLYRRRRLPVDDVRRRADARRAAAARRRQPRPDRRRQRRRRARPSAAIVERGDSHCHVITSCWAQARDAVAACRTSLGSLVNVSDVALWYSVTGTCVAVVVAFCRRRHFVRLTRAAEQRRDYDGVDVRPAARRHGAARAPRRLRGDVIALAVTSSPKSDTVAEWCVGV